MQSSEIVVMDAPSELLPRLPRPASENAAIVYLQKMKENSRRNARHALNTIARLLLVRDVEGEPLALIDWGKVRRQHVDVIQTRLREHYEPATVNSYISYLRGVLETGFILGQMQGDEYLLATKVKPLRFERLPAGRYLPAKERDALVQACVNDDSPRGSRDHAILNLMYNGGLRRSELVALDLADYDTETGAVAVRGGKGDKDRTVYASNGGKKALDQWVQERGSEPGALFQAMQKGGTIERRRLSDQSIYDLLQYRAKEAGVENVSPHDFRRTCLSDLMDAGVDISVVMQYAGHSNVATTQRYDRRGEATKRQASQLLYAPMPERQEKVKKIRKGREKVAAAL
jgi:integrase